MHKVHATKYRKKVREGTYHPPKGHHAKGHHGKTAKVFVWQNGEPTYVSVAIGANPTTPWKNK